MVDLERMPREFLTHSGRVAQIHGIGPGAGLTGQDRGPQELRVAGQDVGPDHIDARLGAAEHAHDDRCIGLLRPAKTGPIDAGRPLLGFTDQNRSAIPLDRLVHPGPIGPGIGPRGIGLVQGIPVVGNRGLRVCELRGGQEEGVPPRFARQAEQLGRREVAGIANRGMPAHEELALLTLAVRLRPVHGATALSR